MANFTKQALINTFMDLLNEQPFNKITVTDIVNRCGVNRNTFYYYYQDIYALVDELFRNETRRLIEQRGDYSTTEEGVANALHFLRENKTAVYHLYDSINRLKLEEYIHDIAVSIVEVFMADREATDKLESQDREDLRFLTTVAVEGVAFEWMHNGMQEDLETNVDNMGRLFERLIGYLLEKTAQAGDGDSPKGR